MNIWDILISFANLLIMFLILRRVLFKPVQKMFDTRKQQVEGIYAEADEKPQHQVTVSSFAIGQTEVTQELWTAVMGNNPSLYDENNKFPVHSITWNDCQNFIAALNSQLHINGYEFAMPTEAQWEFAARGGNQSRGYYYVGSNNIDDVAWYQSNSNDQLHEVGKRLLTS